MAESNQQQTTVGPVFVQIGNQESPWVIDVTQVVEVWHSEGDKEFPYSYKTRDGSEARMSEDSAKQLIEATQALQPRCNHCGQGTMACDHCGAPLR